MAEENMWATGWHQLVRWSEYLVGQAEARMANDPQHAEWYKAAWEDLGEINQRASTRLKEMEQAGGGGAAEQPGGGEDVEDAD